MPRYRLYALVVAVEEVEADDLEHAEQLVHGHILDWPDIETVSTYAEVQTAPAKGRTPAKWASVTRPAQAALFPTERC